MGHFGKISVFVFASVFGVFFANADEKAQRLVSKVVNTYGAEKLKNLKSINIRDNYKVLFVDQGLTPGFTEINKNNIDFTIDFENQRKSLTSWTSSGRGTRLTQTVFDGEKGRIYDLFHNTYDESDYFNYTNIGASTVRSHDTLLAHLIWTSKDSVQHAGEVSHRNQIYDRLNVNMATGQQLTVHINRGSGHISRMTRQHPRFGEIIYVFSNHKIKDGITYAADLQLNIDGQPELISVSRHIQVNPHVQNAFAEPAGFAPRGETIDASEMSVRNLANGVYFAGKGHRYSLFVDAGDYYVASGGNYGLKERFDALKAHTGEDKPLKFQVVTHHHSDHLESMGDAAELGATFITVKEHIGSIEKAVGQEIAKNRFVLVDKKAQFGNGIVEVYNMSSTHSRQNLLVYVPHAKAMFVADHFSTDLKTGLPNADKGTVILRKEIDKLQLDVKTFLGAHGSRILTLSDLHTVADSYADGQCPKGLNLCQ